jgi:hypothetical protein
MVFFLVLGCEWEIERAATRVEKWKVTPLSLLDFLACLELASSPLRFTEMRSATLRSARRGCFTPEVAEIAEIGKKVTSSLRGLSVLGGAEIYRALAPGRVSLVPRSKQTPIVIGGL